MATSFAAYASQYLTKHGTDTVDSEQPLFFSFTTDDGSGHAHQTDVEDLDDPHLNPSHDDDPYLKLDDSPPGWLAHLAHSPRRSRSRSRSSERQRSLSPSSSADNAPPPELLAAPPPRKNSKPNVLKPPPVSELTESLLQREGTDVFSLPDPRHIPRKRRKHHDALWTALWLGAVSISLVLCVILLFTTRRPRDFPAALLPYAVLLRTVPVLTLLTLFSAAAAYAHVYLLRVFAGPVMFITSVFVPATLFVSAIWAFVGSFMWDGDVEPTWGETVGLRLFALVPLVLSLITARRLLHLPRHIHRASSTLTLATHLLVTNPFLAALSPALLLVMLLASLPFLTAIFRLLLIGVGTKGPGSVWEWHVRAWANWGIALVLVVWFWSWAVARGVLRMTAAGVVGAWYFADPVLSPPPPTSTHTIHAALARSTGPSLGTLALSAALLTILRLLSLSLLVLNRLPPLLLAIPFASYSIPGTQFGLGALGVVVVRWIVPGIGWVVAWVQGWEERVSRYVLVYCGMVGVGFWEGAGRAGVLVGGKAWAEREQREAAAEGGNGGQAGRTGRAGRRGRGTVEVRKLDFGTEPSLDLLTISPLTLTLPFSLLTYLFVAHTLGSPHEALGVALLSGAMTAVVGVFCVGVVRDCADTLYLCYCIDKAAGERHREEVFIAFEYDGSANASEPGFGLGAGLPGSVVLPMHRQSGSSGRVAGSVMQHSRRGGPETILPRSPLAGSLVGGAAGAAGGRKKETIFDALEEEDTDTGGRTMKGRGGRHAHSQHHQQQKHQTKQGYHPHQSAALKTPLASYLDSENESIDDHRDERTPTGSQPIGGIARGRPSPSHVPKDDEEDDEMNPFRRSTIDDEEMDQQPQQQRERAWLGQDGHRRSSSGAGAATAAAAYPFATTSPGTSPLSTSPLGAGVGKVGFGFVAPHGHRRSPSGASGLPGLVGATGAGLINVGAGAGQARPGERMLSSTQELNMKSQFLMNMRAFGTESQASAASSGVGSEGEGGEASVMESRMSAGQVHGQGEGEKEEGEESMLGPGSGFFN